MNKSQISIMFMLLFSATFLVACSVGDNNEEKEINCEFELYPPSDTVITSHNAWTQTHYHERINVFRRDSILPNSIVMLGNSLTEQGGDWTKRLGTSNVKNRGISGDNSDGVLARLGEIICAKPSSVFIMIGTNDLWTNKTEVEVGKNIDLIAVTLKEALPDANIFLQTIMPLEEGHEMANRLMEINNEINAFENRKYMLLDTFSEMSNENGGLNSNYTTDGVHLTEQGYKKWAEFLQPYIE